MATPTALFRSRPKSFVTTFLATLATVMLVAFGTAVPSASAADATVTNETELKAAITAAGATLSTITI